MIPLLVAVLLSVDGGAVDAGFVSRLPKLLGTEHLAAERVAADGGPSVDAGTADAGFVSRLPKLLGTEHLGDADGGTSKDGGAVGDGGFVSRLPPLLGTEHLGDADGGDAADAGDAGSVVAAEIDAGPLDAGEATIEAAKERASELTAAEQVEKPGFFDGLFSLAENPRVYGNVRSRVQLDLKFDSPADDPMPENVAEWRNKALLGTELLFQHAKVVAEVRLRHRAVEQRAPAGKRFWGLNGQRAKAYAEVTPGEAYVDLYAPGFDLRLGNQVVSLGANPQGAPADVLSPIDLREGAFFADPQDVKLPVLAARARGDVAGFGITAVVVPFFVPNRWLFTGQDESLVQPGLGASTSGLGVLDASVEDRAQQPLLETERPKDLPQFGDAALRVTRKFGDFTVGADVVATREKLPALTIDPELARFLGEGSDAAFTDPATALSLNQRLGAGERLVRSNYPRYWVAQLEGSALLGPVQVDLDVGFSPKRLYVDQLFNPVFHPTATGALTVSDARGTDLILAGSAILLLVTDIPAGQRLVLIDLTGAEKSAHATYGAGLIGLVGYRWFDGRLEGEARLFLDARQGSRAGSGRATWNFTDHLHATLGIEAFGGPALSPFGYFRRNDCAFGEFRLDW